MCFDFLYNFRSETFSFKEKLSDMWPKTYIGLHVKHPYFLSDCNQFFNLFRQIFEKKNKKHQISLKSV
jgi:type II restriction/modification system DNA methylase subunit YeeA